METNSIIAAIKAIFNGADERDWRKVRAALADDVWFDYQSLSISLRHIYRPTKWLITGKIFFPVLTAPITSYLVSTSKTMVRGPWFVSKARSIILLAMKRGQ